MGGSAAEDISQLYREPHRHVVAAHKRYGVTIRWND